MLTSPTSSNRKLRADNGNDIVCSAYTDVHIVNFSYTIDTAQSDEESIRSAIGELESRSLDWLADNLLPCNGGRRLVDEIELASASEFYFEQEALVADVTHTLSEEERKLRPDLSQELGLVGLKSWPDDILSSSTNCFPTYNKNDTCTVVFGTVSAYLNPSSADAVSESQKNEVERHIRYQMMSLMRSGALENELEGLHHARYLSPIVVLSDKEIRNNGASPQSNLHFSQSSETSNMTVTQSVLIIAACFTMIGAAGLILTIKILFRRDDDEYYSTVKQQQTDDEDSMIPQASRWEEHRTQLLVEAEARNIAAPVTIQDENSQQSQQAQGVNIQDQNTSLFRGSDYGTEANMSATMRRITIKKKVPSIRARCGDMINLGSVMEEDDEDLVTPRSKDQSGAN